jgi:hypothetical protein
MANPTAKLYVDLLEQIKKVNDDTKDARDRKKNAEDELITYMEANNIKEIPAGNGSIQLIQAKKKQTVNLKLIKKIVKKQLTGAAADSFMEELQKERKTVESSKIKFIE